MRVAIEGNIGCGKTTLCTALAAHTRWPVVLEPLHEWSDLLARFYDDPRRWGLTFNVNVMASYMRWSRMEQNAVFERSPLSCRYVFSEVQVQDGHMDAAELGIVDSLFRHGAWTPDVVVYLRCPPDVCMERTRIRGRACEAHVPLDYLQRVHDRYEGLVSRMTTENTTDVVIVDASRPPDAILNDVVERLSRVGCVTAR